MDDSKLNLVAQHERPPITEADLHAYVDRQLTPARRAEIDRYLATRPDALRRVRDWQDQNAQLHRLLDPVLAEPLPLTLPLEPAASTRKWRGLAASLAIAAASAALAWSVRGVVDGDSGGSARSTVQGGVVATATRGDLAGSRSVPPSRTSSTAPTCGGRSRSVPIRSRPWWRG